MVGVRDLAGLLVIVAGLAVTIGGLPWLASRVRTRGVGGSVLGPFDELWHPAAHRARLEFEQQHEQPAPAPSPGDPPFGGRLRIR